MPNGQAEVGDTPCSPGLALHVPRKVTPRLPVIRSMDLEQDFSGDLSDHGWSRDMSTVQTGHTATWGAQTPSQEVLLARQSPT